MNAFAFRVLAGFIILKGSSAGADVLRDAGQVNPLNQVGISARAIGLGSTFVAVADDSSSLFWNPAGLANLQKNEVALHHNSWLAGINEETAVAGFPLGRNSGLGMSLNSINYGSIEGYDSSGSQLSDYSASRLEARLGLAEKFFDALSAGISLNGTWQSLADSNYSNYSVDAGLLFNSSRKLSFGLSVSDLGPALEGSPLATKIRLGGSWHFVEVHRNKFLIVVSEAVEPNGGKSLQAGLEDEMFGSVFLRMGYQARLTDEEIVGLSGLAMGCGISFGKLFIDYAYLPFGDLGSTQRVSLSYKFGRRA